VSTFISRVSKNHAKTGHHFAAVLGLAAMATMATTAAHAEQFCKSVDATGATSYVLAPATGCNKKKFKAVSVSHHITPQPPAPVVAAPAAPAAATAATTTPATTTAAAPATTTAATPTPTATATTNTAATPAATTPATPPLNLMPNTTPKPTTTKY
jgi:hypothetical protein